MSVYCVIISQEDELIFDAHHYYPIVCTDKYDETIRFYESYFNFEIVESVNGMTLLSRAGRDNQCLGIMDVTNPVCVADGFTAKPHGLVLNFQVNNIDLAFQQLQWHGAEIREVATSETCGKRFMTVYDPSGCRIVVCEKDKQSMPRSLRKRGQWAVL